MLPEEPENKSNSATLVTPRFSTDVKNGILSTGIIIISWVVLLYLYPYVSNMLGALIGIIIIFLVMYFLLLPFTTLVFTQWLEIWAYKSAERRVGVPYMNYKKKCQYLKRKRFTFSCMAEQILTFDVSTFEKCHKESMWKVCWPERIPSILEVYDASPDVKVQRRQLSKESEFPMLRYSKQDLAFILAGMKEIATPAATKMYEALTNDLLDPGARISAGYALEEMKNESGIEPLISLVGKFDARRDNFVRSILVRYDKMAVPHLISAIKNCENDFKCGERKDECECVCVCGLIHILGKIDHVDSLPVLEGLLSNENVGEYTRLQIIYSLTEMKKEEGFKIIIKYLEKAPYEEQTVIKQVCLANRILSFPILIDLLSNHEVKEEYYTLIGDILAEVDASTYDKFFATLVEIKGIEEVKRLSGILKENTPEEEEFLRLHAILTKYQTYIPPEIDHLK